jgi:hypothetical protein
LWFKVWGSNSKLLLRLVCTIDDTSELLGVIGSVHIPRGMEMRREIEQVIATFLLFSSISLSFRCFSIFRFENASFPVSSIQSILLPLGLVLSFSLEAA